MTDQARKIPAWLLPTHTSTLADGAHAAVTVERVDLSLRWSRIRFVRAGLLLDGVARGSSRPSFGAETYRLDPHNSPALACTEALGLIARVRGEVAGRMVVLRPAGGGPEAWFSRLETRGGVEVVAALAREGARWARRGGAERWSGPVGLMPGDVCGVQVDGFVGRNMGDVPRWPRHIAGVLADTGFEPANESGFWNVPLDRAEPGRSHSSGVELADVDLTDLESTQNIDWPALLARLPPSTDPVCRLSCDPYRLRHELLRTAVPGGVACALVGGEVVALGVLRPVCGSVPGLRLPPWLTRLRQWKRRGAAAQGQARMWTISDHKHDEWLAAAILDRLSSRARERGYQRLVVGPVGMDCDGTIGALRDRGARIEGRFQLYAQRIDPGPLARP